MSKRLGQALIILFVMGLMVSFSSLLFLVIFFNFSQIPPPRVIGSIAGCAALQIVVFFGGVAFKQRIWPAILMLVCGVATAWVGVIGPATLFGMPSAVLANPEGVNQVLYLATLPVTVVGVGVGIAYFVLGVTCLVRDALAIQARHADPAQATIPPPAQATAQDKQVIYSQVVKMLGVPSGGEDSEAPEEAAAATPEEAGEGTEAEDTETVIPEDAEGEAEEHPSEEPPALVAGETEETTPEDATETAGAPEEPETTAATAEDTKAEADDRKAAITLEDAKTEAQEKTEAKAPAKPPRRGLFARVAAFFKAEQSDGAEPAASAKPAPAALAEPDSEPSPEHEPAASVEPSQSPLSANIVEQPDFAPSPVNAVSLFDIEAGSPAESVYSESETVASETESPASTEASTEHETLPEPVAEEASESGGDAEGTANAAPPKPVQEPAFVGQARDDLLAQWGKLPIRPVPAGDLGVTLETERLRIVRLDRAAFSSLLKGVEEMERVMGLAPSGERLDAGTADAFEALYRQAAADPDNYKWYAVWLITSKSENKLMGSAGFKGVPANGEAALGHGIHAAQRGNGYGPEAVLALCRWGMMQREVQSVLAETGPGDEDAAKALAEAGMQPAENAGSVSCWRMAE